MINKNVFTKTRKSLIQINLIVVIGFLIVFSTFIYGYFRKITYSNIDEILEEELIYTTNQFVNRRVFYPIKLKYPSNLLYIYENGKIRYYTQSDYFQSILPENTDNVKNGFSNYNENGYNFRILSVKIDDYSILIIKNTDSERLLLNGLLLVIIIAIVIALILSYFLAIYLTKKALVPIENAWNNQGKFIQDASHELRTPITIISSKLESLLRNPKNKIEDEVELIADAMGEVRRMKKMIGDLLSLTKEEAISNLNISKIDIVDLIEKIKSEYEDIALIQGKIVNVEFKIKERYIFSDESKLKQMLLIFIDNAFKYTEEGSKISIEVKQKDSSHTTISIIDDGVGIKSEDIPYIFDRFFRSDEVRQKDIDGSGIGLSIAKTISINLKAKISVVANQNEFTKFEITIPNIGDKVT